MRRQAGPWRLATALAAAAFVSASAARPGLPLEVRVLGPDGKGIPDVHVRAGAASLVTEPDGVARFATLPAGPIELDVRHPGFDRVRANPVVRAGAREATLALSPEQLIDLELAVVDAEASEPVAGASVSLVPVRVASAFHGPVQAGVGFDGKTMIGGLPVGEYDARVTAPGFEPVSERRAFDAATRVWRLALKPVSDGSVAWTARVLDGRSGRPIAGAKVVVEESAGSGVLASGMSAADGTSAFEALPLGRANRVVEGRLPRARRACVASIEAEGYVPSRVPVLLGGRTQDVPLTPLARVDEAEPNNGLAEAQEVLAGSTVRCAITEASDSDVFRFDLPVDALVRIEIPTAPVECVLRVQDADGRVLRNVPAHAGNACVADLGGRKPGRLYFSLEEWGRNGASETPFEARIVVVPAPDSAEPNDSPAEARLARVGERLRGVILPASDIDCFRFSVERPGLVRLTMPPGHPLERVVRLMDAEGRVLGETPAHAGNPLALERQLPGAGEYVVSIEEWGRNGESATPYELALDFIPDDGSDDPWPPSAPMRTVRTLAVPGLLHGTLFPFGDVDAYSVIVPHAGRLVVEARSSTDLVGTLFSSDGKVLAEAPAHPNSVLRLTHDADEAKAVAFAVRGWGNDDASVSPYRIRCWLEAAEAMETIQRNETMATAFPAEAGETLVGSIFPIRDQDFYRFDVPYPGRFRVRGTWPIEVVLTLRRPDGTPVVESPFHPGEGAIEALLLPGPYYLHIREWGDNGSSPRSYRLGVTHDRAEPGETVPLAGDPSRPLPFGQARAFVIDQLGDVDRFLFESPGALDATLRVFSPLEGVLRVFDDRTGRAIHERPWHGGLLEVPLKSDDPVRYRIEVREWGDNGWTLDTGFVLVAPKDAVLAADRVRAVPGDGLDVVLRREAVPGLPRPASVKVALDTRGVPEIELPADEPRTLRLPASGTFRARVASSGPGQAPASHELWVTGRENLVREGVMLSVDEPMPGQELERAIPLVARAFSYTSKAVSAVRFELDGKLKHEDFSPPYEWAVDWQQVVGKEHRLRVEAVDADGRGATLDRAFRLSPFMGLQPGDGATVSGERVVVSWTGTDFGKAAVRWRRAGGGTAAWASVEGEDGRFRSVALQGLEPGHVYEFQAVSGTDESPVRTVHLVKGLAFGKPAYGANIRRDYNQRVGISVRNNGDQPLTVRLECGKPEDPRLFVGFVGEGSEDVPFELGPGEEREFVLGISAQDVVTEQHSVPVRITSAQGLSDEALVRLNVRLPVVKLEWSDLGATPFGMGRRYRLRNAGDAVTDLALFADQPGVSISPAVSHGLLPAGATLEVKAYPVLTEGFQALNANVVARGLDKEFPVPFEARLAAGERLFRVNLRPGSDATEAVDPVSAAIDAGRMLAAEYLLPDTVDWTQGGVAEDTDGDGVPDRVRVLDATTDTLWVGDDMDGDRAVDFAHADLGADGTFEYSAFLMPSGDWERTNLVEGWLEMGFALPWARETYHPHDVDIVLNGHVIGRLKDALPEGNYTFRIPPAALKFGDSGRPEGNRIGIKTQHLRGGHYVVNSDFRFRLRLTETGVWSAGKDVAEAGRRARQIEGVRFDGADFSLSASKMVLTKPDPLKAGDEVWIEVPVRNLGAARPPRLELALRAGLPGQALREESRVRVDPVPLSGTTIARVPWKARGGASELRLVLDPDGTAGDTDTRNNEAVLTLRAEGDDRPPVVELREPAAGARSPTPVVALRARVRDDTALARVEVAVDGGLWEELSPAGETVDASLVLQPGEHVVRLRATDTSGLSATAEAAVRVEGRPDAAKIVFPPPGKEILARATKVMLNVPPATVLAAARVGGGPWHRARIAGTVGTADVPLRFGPQTIEVMTVSPVGLVGQASVEVRCMRQPVAGAVESVDAVSEGGVASVRGVGRMDFFTRWNGVVWPAGAGSSAAHQAQEAP